MKQASDAYFKHAVLHCTLHSQGSKIRSLSEKSRARYKQGIIKRSQHELSGTNRKMTFCPDEERIPCLLLSSLFYIAPVFDWKAQVTEEKDGSIRNVFSLVVKSKKSCF
ncbi:hypothetical protein AVEN_232694-1 [Araneus ventricosus]|uniref:Uncharacterized protein n=1 Tax=Araneus ventricosus TaxID=182803 RepID=A0A4Y2HGT5_ARAVE|nr:hypothetical protein AVEN_232694-1 [Araneus ventricosus]